MTFKINEKKSISHLPRITLWVAVLMSVFMFAACSDKASEEVVTEAVVTEEKELSEVADVSGNETEVIVAEVEEVIVVPPVTEVVYDFDSFESVSSISPSRLEYSEPIRGIYVSGHAAGSSKWIDNIITMADETEINAFVIDVKTDDGHLSFKMDHEEANSISADRKIIPDIEGLMDKLYEHDIYPIARIVTFKDPYLASNKTEYAIKNKDGSLWKYKGIPWLNPYNKDSWPYILDVAKEAARVGFKEIQFDYIRFEATRYLKDADFGGLDTIDRKEIVLEFVDYAMAELEPLGVKVSADVFGIVIKSDLDAKTIGQNYVEMSKRLDVICPMVYPSHYGPGFYGYNYPDLHPYGIIEGSMGDSNEVLSVIPEGEHVAIVRPWLQAFTASYLGSGKYMTYDKNAIRAQIDATYDAGLTEWILWHAGVKYNTAALLPAEDVTKEVE